MDCKDSLPEQYRDLERGAIELNTTLMYEWNIGYASKIIDSGYHEDYQTALDEFITVVNTYTKELGNGLVASFHVSRV